MRVANGSHAPSELAQARAGRGPGPGPVPVARVFERHLLGLECLQLTDGNCATDRSDIDLILVDTALEAQCERALETLRRADWLLVPVTGPEEGSGTGA